jgi:hypothetical protein
VAPNSVVPFHPSVPSKFNFLLDTASQPLWGPERLLVDRAEHAANNLWFQFGLTQLQFLKKESKAERKFWERYCPQKSVPRRTAPPPRVDSEAPWPTPKSPFKFFGDIGTSLPGPWREPIKFSYFSYKPNCPNPISPNDLLDESDRPLNKHACPHSHGLLRRGESARTRGAHRFTGI